MHDWTKVVTEPLGLAGFALFLVFGALSRFKAKSERRLLASVASGMAVLALIGGLVLAYFKTASAPQPALKAPAAQAEPNATLQQTTTGKGSPIVQGVQGDVTITIDQSEGTRPNPKPQATKKAGQ